MRLNLIYYGKHDVACDARIYRIHPDYIIGNPPHGLWGEISGNGNQDLLQNVAGFQEEGIKVIGYITAGYEGMHSSGAIGPYWYSLGLNKKLIRSMAQIDHVDGVFIDECSAYPDKHAKRYLKELTDFAKSYDLVTWGNVGKNWFAPWFFTEGGFDRMQSTEDWHGQPLTRVQSEYNTRISVTGFKPSYTAQDALRLTTNAWRKGLAYCYINNTEYNTIALWFEEFISLIRHIELVF
ncbi:MAG: spherulation-specific family 4 protein [Chloroflexota bacterium]